LTGSKKQPRRFQRRELNRAALVAQRRGPDQTVARAASSLQRRGRLHSAFWRMTTPLHAIASSLETRTLEAAFAQKNEDVPSSSRLVAQRRGQRLFWISSQKQPSSLKDEDKFYVREGGGKHKQQEPSRRSKDEDASLNSAKAASSLKRTRTQHDVP
jgi:hypothetical protein